MITVTDNSKWWEQTPTQKKELEGKLAEVIAANKKRHTPKKNENIREEINERYRSHFYKSTYNTSTNNLGKGYLHLDNLHILQQLHYKEFNGKPVLHFPEYFRYVKVYLPIGNIPYHVYGQHLKAIGHQFIVCNPTLTITNLNDYLLHIFTTYVAFLPTKNFKYDSTLIEIISKEIFKTKPKPTYSKAKFLWNPDYDLSGFEKKGIVNKINGQVKKSKTLVSLKKTYETGMTQAELALLTGKGIDTIKRHWKNLKAA